MEVSGHGSAPIESPHVRREDASSYLPSSLWQWEANDDEVQEDQPYNFNDDVAVNDWNEADFENQILESTDAALQKNNHRLLLQGLISALVVVLSGFLVMVFNITSWMGFIIFGGNSIAFVAQSFGSTIHFYLLALRLTAEILIVLGIIAIFAHRIIGFGLGVYLRAMLDPEHIGQYAFHFDWVSLRCGLDQNMLVIAGLEWRNPPLFTNTPYFLRISEINFVIDSASVFRALTDEGESIKISQVKLDKATIYLEKLTQRSINRATSAAAQKLPVHANPSESTATQEAAALDASVHKEAHTDLDDDADSITTPKKTKQPRKPLPVGMLNLWACLGATNADQEASFLSSITASISKALSGTTNMVQLLGSAVTRIDVAGTLFRKAQNVGSTIGSTIGSGLTRTFGGGRVAPTRDRTRTESTVDSAGAAMSDEDSSHNNRLLGDMNASTHSNTGQSEGGGTLTMAETLALLRAEYPDLVLPPLPEDAIDEEDRLHSTATSNANSAPASAATSAKVDPKKKNKKSDKNDFGIPRNLEIDQLYVHDIQVHAQDFLNAKHTKDRKAGVIKLKSLVMFRTELTLPPDRRVGGKRRGIRLGMVVWRLVNKLLSELLRHNSIAMMVLLSSAAASHTTSAVSSGAGIATYSASTTKKAFTGLGSVFGGGNAGKSPARGRSDTATLAPASTVRARSDTGASVGSVSGGQHSAGEAHSAPLVSRETSTNIHSTQAQTAAQSAFKTLNATGADVQKTAVNAFQSIMKRTTSSKQN